MRSLKHKLNKKNKAIKKRQPEIITPEYGIDGSVIKEPKKSVKWILITGGVMCSIAAIIYIPSFFYHSPSLTGKYFMHPDPSGIKNVVDYVKDSPDADFDEDGVSNSQELQYNTSPRKTDTDGDGLADYAELYITETQPNQSNNDLVRITSETVSDMSAPYKINNVVLWADDTESYVYGGMVRTTNGYRFCNFTGWVQFPDSGVAYKIKDGVHIPLKHKSEENAWRIDDECEIRIYGQELDMVHRLKIVGLGPINLADNFFGKSLSFLLPDNSIFIACQKIAEIDTQENPSEKTIDVKVINFDYNDFGRYGRNHNKLSDLARVYQTIDMGHCVLVSLNSADDGEIVGIIYGYTNDGDLLIANKDTLEPAGKIYIEEQAGKLLDNDGKIVQYEWYEFYGCGFNSKERLDRISFFAASLSGLYKSEDVRNNKTTYKSTTLITEGIEETAESTLIEIPEGTNLSNETNTLNTTTEIITTTTAKIMINTTTAATTKANTNTPAVTQQTP